MELAILRVYRPMNLTQCTLSFLDLKNHVTSVTTALTIEALFICTIYYFITLLLLLTNNLGNIFRYAINTTY